MLYQARNRVCKLSKSPSGFQTLPSPHSSSLPDDITEKNSRSVTEKKHRHAKRARVFLSVLFTVMIWLSFLVAMYNKNRKNRPEMKAFLFNILGTIADNLRALIEFTPL